MAAFISCSASLIISGQAGHFAGEDVLGDGAGVVGLEDFLPFIGGFGEALFGACAGFFGVGSFGG